MHGSAIPATLLGQERCIVVPLNAYSEPFQLPDGWTLFHARRELAAHHLAELQARVDASLDRLAQELGPADFSLVEYESTVLCTVMEYWDLVYSLVAAEFSDRLLLTDSLADKPAGPSDLSSTLSELRLTCMADRLPRVGLVDSPQRAEHTHVPLKAGVSPGFPWLVDVSFGFARRASDSLRFRTASYWHRLPARSRATTALVITQQKKRGALLAQLRGRIPFRQTSVAALRLSGFGLPAGATPPSANGSGHRYLAVDAVGKQARATTNRIKHNAALLEALVNEEWEYLLTDQEYDPVVRRIVELAVEKPGLTVVATPEGAQSILNAAMLPTVLNAFRPDPRIVRCATSVGEADRLVEVFHCRVIPSGYLATPPRPPGRFSPLSQAMLRVLLLGSRRSNPRPVLVNIDNEADVGMTRVGWPSMVEKLDSFARLISALDASGTPYIVTCKSAAGIGALRNMDNGRSQGIFVNVPWSVLASLCSVVIQRDSSLGPEAIARGIPTIVWDDRGLPLASREWIEGNDPWVQLCTDEPGLREALARIEAGIAPEKTPHPWDLIRPDRQVADWILTDRQDRKASEGTASTHQSSSIEPGD